MFNSSKTIAVAAGLLLAGLATDRANAVPFTDPSAVRDALADLNVIDNAQYVWGGRNYCWYTAGWHGPGWYWCGYAWRRGFGWGGPVGWRGWVWRGPGWVGRVGRVGRYGARYGARYGGRVGRVGRVGRTGANVGRVGRTGGRVGRGGGGGRVGRGGGGGGRGGRRSDIMLKHDITLLGHLDNGLGFYRFSYNGSEKAYVGVMAQEVQTIAPQAVVRGRDGYLRVHYDTLGVKFQSYDEWIASGGRVPAGTSVRR